MNDKTRTVTWLCDERVDPADWQPCQNGAFSSVEELDACWLSAMATAATGICTTTAEADLDAANPGTDSNCACDRYEPFRFL